MSINPRYAAYAKTHGKSPDEMLEYDRTKWPGGIMCGYILWNTARLKEYSRVNPDAFTINGLIDHTAYNAWLASAAHPVLA